MLNIQLYFANQEVELNDNISFPLNKTFENLWNPTEIVVEYSKSINIPATVANNKLMANAYRIDRQFVINDNSDTNIGIYLDPLKRIPMRLVYNNEVLLDGYAKYTSATVNSKQTYYTFNLYGALGDIFQKLSDCVVDENKLTDEQKAESDSGAKYVIETPWYTETINASFVKNSFDHYNPSITHNVYGSNIKDGTYDCIGMAPAYRGLYEDFDSTTGYGITWYSFLDGEKPTEPESVEDQLKNRWRINLINKNYTEENAQARIDALDYNAIVPNGLNEHQMRQLRSYEQKPYIYIHSLMQIFINKCEQLTGYKINLDKSWFNVNNPYWRNLCYMFDYLSVKGNTLQSSLPFTGYTVQPYTSAISSDATAEDWSTGNYEMKSSATYTITDTDILNKGDIILQPFTLGLQSKCQKDSTHVPKNCQLTLLDWDEVLVDVEVTSGGTTSHYYYWGATSPQPYVNGIHKLRPPFNQYYKEDNFVSMTNETKYDNKTNELIGIDYLTVPSFKIKHTKGQSITVKYTVQLNCYEFLGAPVGVIYLYNGTSYTMPTPLLNSDTYQVIYPNIDYNANWRNSTVCSLKNLYTKDEPLFNVLLQYTKMFGLIWKPDYQNKTIDIMTRSTYFRDYKIVDWTKKVDKSKDIKIEPVSFASKYITFNYDDTEGYHYSGYKKKYGVEYGEKKIRTKYNFDTNNTDLFKNKIKPSSVSCKSFSTINDLKSWDTLTRLPNTPSTINFIDCENDDENAAIAINNWYFRAGNAALSEWWNIVDVTDKEITDDRYYWVGSGIYEELGMTPQLVNYLPMFSPVMKALNGIRVGCLFNCPNEDYTNDQQITQTQGRFIYDVCWNDYVNERYNGNNKKLTAYVRLTPEDFNDFNFKTFVTIDNQLFAVNKIIDYDVKSPTTKVELIQVTNITGYTKPTVEFPDKMFSSNELFITTGSDYNGSVTITVYSETIPTYTVTPVQNVSDNSWFEWGDSNINEYATTITFNYGSNGTYNEVWRVRFSFDDGTYKDIPIYINGGVQTSSVAQINNIL